MAPTPSIEELEANVAHLSVIISAAEPWHADYLKNPKAHAKLLKQEADLEKSMRDYFRSLADTRLDGMILWSQYNSIVRGYDVRVTINDEALAGEEGVLLTTLHDGVLATIALGASVAEDTYAIPLGLSEASKSIQQAARNHTASLVKGINATTRDRIQQSLKTSITLGEDQIAASNRLRTVISDYKRAQTIARTEAVSAYTQGGYTFATKTGAVSMTWQAIGSACNICGPLDGKTRPIDGNFGLDVGSGPPAHPNCRCSVAYNYETGNPDDLPAIDEL